MLLAFKEHIEQHFTDLKNSKSLLACSGGVDSVVLAHLLFQSRIAFDMAHCNFGLRGAESDEDERFVKKLGNNMDCRVFTKSFDISAEKGSVQMAARRVRYDWFQELSQANGYDYVVTAHHADDDIETFLINLSRSTGIDGLTGIPPQNNNILRPLLFFTREEILAFAQAQQLKWREDSSNEDTKYLRNKIRHHIVPELKSLNPQFAQNFRTTQLRLQGTAKLLQNHIEKVAQQLWKFENGRAVISIADIHQLEPLEEYLYHLFRPYGFKEIENLHELLTAPSGKQLLSKTHRLVKDRNTLLLVPLVEEPKMEYIISASQTEVTQPFKMTMIGAETFKKESKSHLYVDQDLLEFPLTLRRWKEGDYFYPLGMKGKKKVSKFFKDEKIDILSKEAQWLLCSGDAIVWIVGKRGDDRFKVTPNTQNILKFSMLP